jgi:hypothetical protein
MRDPEYRKTKPMPDELDSQAQPENEPETEMSSAPHEDRSLGRSLGEPLLEVLNPVEGFFEDPRLGLALLVLIAVGTAIAFIGMGLWAAVQETFFGGGPPQGLGLK